MTQPKPRCLIVVTALRYSGEYGEAAIRSAAGRREDALILLVLDPDVPGGVAERLAEEGFLGERLMHELRDTMAEEYRDRGRSHLEDMERRARAAGVRTEIRIAEGPLVENVREVVIASGFTRVLAAQAPRSALARLFLTSEGKALRAAVDVPVDMFSLDGRPETETPRGARRG